MSQDYIDSDAVCNPEEFPCYFPRKRHMGGKKIGWKPFVIRGVIRNARQLRKWSMQTHKKYGDRVCCFYCGGRLFQWKAYDNPWYEHAKWFPLCEYVLKK